MGRAGGCCFGIDNGTRSERGMMRDCDVSWVQGGYRSGAGTRRACYQLCDRTTGAALGRLFERIVTVSEGQGEQLRSYPYP